MTQITKKRLSESLILSESNDFVNQLPEKIYIA